MMQVVEAYTKTKPIKSPSDLKGLKIRVMESVTAMKMVESMGRFAHSYFLG